MRFPSVIAIFLALWIPLLPAQEQTEANPKVAGSRFVDELFNFLNMAGTKKSKEFRPMTQPERNRLYFKTMMNPLGFVKVGFSAGIDQANDKPREWEQGASGYGKRFANILGQYSIQRTVTYGLGSTLHEDNRYFNSGRQGFWPRTGYALASGILARHDDGSLHFSISQVGGVAAGAFLARTWLPPSQSSASAGAVSFGITLASNMGFSVVKEFLPDLGRALAKKHKQPATGSGSSRSTRCRTFGGEGRGRRRVLTGQRTRGTVVDDKTPSTLIDPGGCRKALVGISSAFP